MAERDHRLTQRMAHTETTCFSVLQLVVYIGQRLFLAHCIFLLLFLRVAILQLLFQLARKTVSSDNKRRIQGYDILCCKKDRDGLISSYRCQDNSAGFKQAWIEIC